MVISPVFSAPAFTSAFGMEAINPSRSLYAVALGDCVRIAEGMLSVTACKLNRSSQMEPRGLPVLTHAQDIGHDRHNDTSCQHKKVLKPVYLFVICLSFATKKPPLSSRQWRLPFVRSYEVL